ncbi:MAG: PBP1A family penicillin-binding protein [Alphaproteobacteria bacterium]|nr:PBP1A family penicillin-binding protein [Alphaproteobacteria bacterium]
MSPDQEPRRRRSGRRLVLVSAWLSGAAVLAAGLSWCLHDLPPLDIPKAAAAPPSLTVLAADGTMLARLGSPAGQEITPDRLPKTLVAAVVATEDRRFFAHAGIDPVGIARAVVENLRTGAIGQGGSTITQQLAKMIFLSPERTVKRKLQELVLALELEHRYSKAQILALYLNRAYFGEGVFGADAAARRYFGQPVNELGVAQAALLAGALKAPSRYNLVADRAAAADRARTVLANMVAAHLIAPAQAAAAGRQLDHIEVRQAAPAGGYFADWVIGRVRGMPQTWGRNVVVTTTLDARLQADAEARLATLLEMRGESDNVSQGAVVVMTPEGDIKAMVGGRQYAQSPFNRAVQAMRQPGSTFKIFAYLAAFESGASENETVIDAPVRIGDWAPDNYKGRYWGPVTVKAAFAQSLNSAAVRLAERVGTKRIAETARRLGIDSELTNDATLVLGSSAVNLLELTGAVATLASGGIKSDIAGIREIRDADDGSVLYRHEPTAASAVIDPRSVAAMDDLMSEVVRSGTGKAARLDRPAAGKTGTSQDSRDAWFVGFTGDYVAGVWLGNDDDSPMHKVSGGGDPAALWRQVMLAAHAGLPPLPLRKLPPAEGLAGASAAQADRDPEAVLRLVTGG